MDSLKLSKYSSRNFLRHSLRKSTRAIFRNFYRFFQRFFQKFFQKCVKEFLRISSMELCRNCFMNSGPPRNPSENYILWLSGSFPRFSSEISTSLHTTISLNFQGFSSSDSFRKCVRYSIANFLQGLVRGFFRKISKHFCENPSGIPQYSSIGSF